MKKWLISILGAVVAGVLVYWITIGADSPLKVKRSEIYEPTDGASVSQKTAVKGWCSESDAKNDLWLVVQPVESPYYHPQPGPIPKDKDGQWRGIAYVGTPDSKNIGEEYLIFVVATNPTVSKVFSDYLRDSNNKGKWTGLQTLPDGTTSIDSLRVIRK